MVTREQVRIFLASQGDNSHLIAKDRSLIDASTYQQIYELIKGIWRVRNGLASKEFEDRLQEQIVALCDSQRTVSELYQLADKRWVRKAYQADYTSPWWAFWEREKHQ